MNGMIFSLKTQNKVEYARRLLVTIDQEAKLTIERNRICHKIRIKDFGREQFY